MTKFISKTTFKDFIECPKNTWLKNNRPDLKHLFTPTEFAKHLFEQGNEVEKEAQRLFSNVTIIDSTGDNAVQNTQQAIKKKTTISQATFAVDGLYAKLDILEYNTGTDSWNMYEIKSSSSVKDNGQYNKVDHITDAAFQALVLQKADIPINKFFLIHLDKEYIRSGDLNVHELFCIEDETEKILTRANEIKDLVEASKEYLARDVEPKGGCECVYKTRSNHCATFKISNPSIPEYGVHDISRIHKKKLELCMERGVYEMCDVPEDLKLSDKQKTQVRTATNNKLEIDEDLISEQLDSLVFPLYFLDYEAVSFAMPKFDGYNPYAHIPFQFSLHVLDNPNAELKECGYLHKGLLSLRSGVLKPSFIYCTRKRWKSSAICMSPILFTIDSVFLIPFSCKIPKSSAILLSCSSGESFSTISSSCFSGNL